MKTLTPLRDGVTEEGTTKERAQQPTPEEKGRYHPRTQVILPAVARGISHTQKETQMAHGATKKATQPRKRPLGQRR